MSSKKVCLKKKKKKRVSAMETSAGCAEKTEIILFQSD